MEVILISITREGLQLFFVKRLLPPVVILAAIIVCLICIVSKKVVAGPGITVAQPKGLTTRYPQQTERAIFEEYIGGKMQFSENPIFTDMVKKGELPPVSQRLPVEPLVVMPYEKIGKYGGTLNGLSMSFEAGTAEVLSWRQANLVRFNDDIRTIVPNVAKSWQWSRDYKEITFTLRRGHRWSDGVPFTADDVVFYLNDIILNKDIYPITPDPWGLVGASCEKIDEVTVRFKFERPYPSLLAYLGGVGSFYDPFAPRHFLEKFHAKYNPDADKIAQENGFSNWAGYFRVYWDRWRDSIVSKASGVDVPTLESHMLQKAPTSTSRIFVANPYYFKVDTCGNQLPYINQHHEHFLEQKLWYDEIINGRIDQKSQNVPLSLYLLLLKNQQKGSYSIQLSPTGSGPAMIFNKTHKDPVLRAVYGDPRFNKAMSLAINREELNGTLFLGLCKPQQGLPQNVPFVSEADKLFMVEYAPERANAFLDDMGLKPGVDGIRLLPDGRPLTVHWDYTLQYVSSNEFPAMIAGYWRAVGVRVILKEESTVVIREKQADNALDITNAWFAPFEPTLYAAPRTFMPPYSTNVPIMGMPWLKWRDSHGEKGMEPPLWVKKLWEIGDEFVTLNPGSEWYNNLGGEMVRLNLDNLTIIGTLADVPLVTIVSDRLGNVPRWLVNTFFYGYTYPSRADQWYFK